MNKIVGGVLTGIVALGVISACSHSDDTRAGFNAATAPASSATPSTYSYVAPEPAPVVPAFDPNTLTDGTYLVGSDIQPGTYRTMGNADGTSCYWARHKNLNGDLGSITANHLSTGRDVVNVRKGDATLELSLGCTWVRQ